MVVDDSSDEKGFVVDIGRASEGRTFVKVRHVKSSICAHRVGIGTMSTKAVARELIAEVIEILTQRQGGSEETAKSNGAT